MLTLQQHTYVEHPHHHRIDIMPPKIHVPYLGHLAIKQRAVYNTVHRSSNTTDMVLAHFSTFVGVEVESPVDWV